jgi:uncharacterized protein YybS (DUF2232 family)
VSPGRVLVVVGVVLVVVGLLVQAFPWLGRLPGDIRIERPGFSFYLPITTCLLISAVISLALHLLSRR